MMYGEMESPDESETMSSSILTNFRKLVLDSGMRLTSGLELIRK